MTVALKGPKPASESDIAELEAAIGRTLPTRYRKFLAIHNGTRPEENIFDISESSSSGVNHFIPLNEILDARNQIDKVRCGFLPIARDSCGNYVCINLDSDGEVFFWDHEEPSRYFRLAAHIDAFLLVLRPFDASHVELKPEQVKSVWIDPEFLKQQEDEGNLA